MHFFFIQHLNVGGFYKIFSFAFFSQYYVWIGLIKKIKTQMESIASINGVINQFLSTFPSVILRVVIHLIVHKDV